MTTPGCRKARDWAAQMFAGEMEPEARRELDTHLRACPACAAEEENIRRELSLLKTEDPPDPGVPYWSSFSGRLRTRIAAYQRRRRTLRLAVLAAAAVLVAALALLRPRHEVPPRQIAEGPVVACGEPRTTPSLKNTRYGVVPFALPSFARQRPFVQSVPPCAGTASNSTLL